ncbi:MAG: FmdB family zinc ribbon protein [Marmoricola sp.]
MPTYQYACTDCGHDFEIVQSFSDDSLTVCPECEGRLRKVFNAVGVVFKGSGFYRTDSREKTGPKSSSSGESTSNGSSPAKEPSKESSTKSSTESSTSTSSSTSTPSPAA